MNYFLDTEFNEFGGDLISLALVREDNCAFLYVATDCKNPGAWVAANVLPIIDAPGADAVLIHPTSFGRFIEDFLDGDEYPNIVADWPDDIRYFCQALITGPGEMINIPRVAFEVRRVDAYPTTLAGAVQHNALWDARALRHYFVSADSPLRTAQADGE